MTIETENQIIEVKEVLSLAKTWNETDFYPKNDKLLNYLEKLKNNVFVFVLMVKFNGDDIFFYFRKNEKTEKETRLKFLGVGKFCFSL